MEKNNQSMTPTMVPTMAQNNAHKIMLTKIFREIHLQQNPAQQN